LAQTLTTLNGKITSVGLQVHTDDFVGRILGQNPATYGTHPEDSSTFGEWIHIFGKFPTVHSCYGNGGVACNDKYNPAETTIIFPKGE
jgi:hypothetical protein